MLEIAIDSSLRGESTLKRKVRRQKETVVWIKENPICEEKMPETLYRIGMFAGMNHVTIKTLRYYDEQELLKPAAIDVQTGYRYYKLGQMSQLHQIRALRNMGLRIDEIKKILNQSYRKTASDEKTKQILLELASLTKKLAQD